MFTLTSKECVSILRFTPIILGSILLFSLTDFGLAVAYAKQLYKAPLDESKWYYSKDKRWSTAWFVLYSGFFPFLSFTHAFIDAALFFFAQLNPICTLLLSILVFVGWIIQVSFWCHCDYTPDSDTCYQFYIVGNPYSDMSGSLSGVSDGITATKVAFGMIVLTFYIAYLVLATIAVHEMRSTDHVRIDDDEEQDLDNCYPMEDRQIASSSFEHLTSLSRFLGAGTGT
ncbi:MAG: hypothetical protein ASARMPREDX12_007134 [Alectoria sarmentosa]|nr:MAG: hypothetical protein ASARMPREDX12_007134 [Alectoria sarmentosa]